MDRLGRVLLPAHPQGLVCPLRQKHHVVGGTLVVDARDEAKHASLAIGALGQPLASARAGYVRRRAVDCSSKYQTRFEVRPTASPVCNYTDSPLTLRTVYGWPYPRFFQSSEYSARRGVVRRPVAAGMLPGCSAGVSA